MDPIALSTDSSISENSTLELIGIYEYIYEHNTEKTEALTTSLQ